MRTNSEIVEEVKRKAKEYEMTKKRRLKAMSISFVSICLVVAISLGVAIPRKSENSSGVTFDIGLERGASFYPMFSENEIKSVSIAVASGDCAVWNDETNSWDNQGEYDIDLSIYPKSITRFLAYQMETKKAESTYFWAYITPIDAYVERVFFDDDYLIDTFVKIVKEISAERISFDYAENLVVENEKVPCGAYVLWTREEILSLAEKYEELFPDHKYVVRNTTNYAGISICATKNMNDKFADKMSSALYGAYNEANDDDYLPISLQIKVGLFAEEKYRDYLDELDNWSTVVEIYKKAIELLPNQQLIDDVEYDVSTNVDVIYNSKPQTDSDYHYVCLNREKIDSKTLKVVGGNAVNAENNIPILFDIVETSLYKSTLQDSIAKSVEKQKKEISVLRWYNTYVSSSSYVCITNYSCVFTKKQISSMLDGPLSNYIFLDLANFDIYNEEIQSILFKYDAYSNPHSIEQKF